MHNEAKQAKAIFDRAVEIPSATDRDDFVVRECADDEGLRSRVQGLLGAYEQADSFLESPPAGLRVAATVDRAPDERPGTVVGPYKLLEQIGEGGFGVVFMAEQTHPVRRKVALKVLKPGMDTRQVVGRFEAERQALAIMDHPNIAKVFDGGATDSGRPFFVMELVKGVPITDYCDQNLLTPRQRLELFVSVCQAVQHAHQKGIIHRDIKPSNVLVTVHDTTPVVKVIDFGVAKALGQELTDKTLFTGFAQMIGTPLYMSPEQAGQSGLDVDTRSDIYSLGMLLYELLTGTTPFDRERFQRAAYDEIRRIIREEEPPKPSTRLSELGRSGAPSPSRTVAAGSPSTLASVSASRHTEPAKLTRLLRGEVDWIVMKALEKDRNRRYETANGFAADVLRYLADEAVQACPPSAGYRFRKFARRNKRAMVSITLLALAILVTAGTLGWAIRDRESRAQEAARERAAREATVEQEVNRALKEAEQWQGQEKWSEALSALKRAEGLLATGGRDELRERVHQFRKDLDTILRLEECRTQRGPASDAVRQTEAYARAFADVVIDVEGLSPTETAAGVRRRPRAAVQVAAALDDWARVLRDCGFRDSKRDPAVWKRLLEIARLADPDPWRSELRQLMGREDLNALRKLADASDVAGLPVQSLQQMGAALAIGGDMPACVAWLRRAHRQHPGDALLAFDLAFHLSELPSADWAEVLRFAEAALAAQQNPGMYDYVGVALSELRRYDEAVTVYHKAIELNPDYAPGYAGLGFAFLNKGQTDEAIANFLKSIQLNSNYERAYAGLGFALSKKGQTDEAIAAYRKAVRLEPNNTAMQNRLTMMLDERAWQLITSHDPQARNPILALELAKLAQETLFAVPPDARIGIGGLNFTAFTHWNVTRGSVDLTGYGWLDNYPGNGAHVDLDGSTMSAGRLESKALFPLPAGTYELRFDLGTNGGGPATPNSARVTLGSLFDETFERIGTIPLESIVRTITVTHPTSAHLVFDHSGGDNAGLIIDNVKLTNQGPAMVLLEDNFNRDSVLEKERRVLRILGAAHYRAGDWKAAVAALEKSTTARNGGDSNGWFFLAMAHRQLGDKAEARKWYDQAVAWMDKNQPENEQLRHFRAEAAKLLGVVVEVGSFPREKP